MINSRQATSCLPILHNKQKGKYRTAWGYAGGIEFYPMESNLHFFLAYVGRSYKYTDRAKALGEDNFSTHRVSVEKPKGIISLGAKMGEGWLLTAEMIELVQGGYGNIVCAQPFGCLPNHIVGKGMVNKIRALYPSANITPIDYDPSATKVNQENRIKLMLAVAKERLNATVEAKPLTAEEIAGGAPKVGAAV